MYYPTVSYLIPAYNVATYLSDCVASIWARPIDKEIIIIDDGSTDDTMQVAVDLAAKYDHIRVYHQANSGVSSARNYALSQAHGKWVVFVDADDEVMNEGSLEKIFSFADTERVDVIKGIYKMTDDVTYYKHPTLPRTRDGSAAVVHSQDYLNYAVGDFYFTAIGAYFIRRCSLLKLGVQFHTELSLAEDIIFFYELLSHNLRLLEVPFLFYHYKIRRTSAAHSRSSPKHLLASSRYLDRLFQLYQQHSCHYLDCEIKGALLRFNRAYQNIFGYYGYNLQEFNNPNITRYVLPADKFAALEEWEKMIHENLGIEPSYLAIDKELKAVRSKRYPPPHLSIILVVGKIVSFDMLTNCLQNLLEIKLKKEILLIDNGAGRGCLDVMMDFSHRYDFVHSIYQQAQGISKSYQLGLEVAKGDYVWFLQPELTTIPSNFTQMLSIVITQKANILRWKLVKDQSKLIVRTTKLDFESALMGENLPSLHHFVMKRAILHNYGIDFSGEIEHSETYLLARLYLCSSNQTIVYVDFTESNTMLSSVPLREKERHMIANGWLFTAEELPVWAKKQANAQEIEMIANKFAAFCKDKAWQMLKYSESP
ncbi:MAG: glycosyltransferase [[Actinobacillus] rossii]|nr:glycosyltransferase [[Actinobacillus] rossii]MDY5792997.1 glycosyltransferase [[Actinobacillus] rossii]